MLVFTPKRKTTSIKKQIYAYKINGYTENQ